MPIRANQKFRRLLSLCWLLLIPAVDGALVALFSPQLRTGNAGAPFETYVFTALTTVVFWAGLFLLVHQAILSARTCHGKVMRLVWRGGVRMFLLGLHLYVILLWGFIVTSGNLPNPEAVVFLMDNLARVPQHLMQTSPVLVLGTLGLSLAAAFMTESAVGRLGSGDVAKRNWRPLLAATCALVAWHVMTPLGMAWSPVAFALSAESDERIEARARTIIGGLEPKSAASAETPPPKKFPVVVILVESLRHDLLSDHPDAIPFLKSLHDSNIGFDFAYATASHSNLTDLAFWYSQYPLRGAGKETYPADAPWRGSSLFGVFKDSGYRTAYISSQNERWGNMGNWLKTRDVDYFFDSESYEGNTWENFDDLAGLGGMLQRGLVTAGKIEDSRTLEIARRWIADQAGNEGFFLGMNLQNTHFSYVMPPQGIEPYQPADLGFRAVYYRWPESKKANVRNRYLNAVANVDRQLAAFAQDLKKRGLWDECLFVVVGDNGEGFYEHGFGNHSGPMYDEAVRTFSVIKLPQSMRNGPLRVEHPVSHIDIAATIPDIAGIRIPDSFQGLPLQSGERAARPVYMYSNAIVRQYGIVSWPWKLLITEFPEPGEELYRLDQDPGESLNLASTSHSEKQALAESLKLWVSTQRRYYGSSAYVDRVPPRYLPSSLSD